MSDQSLQHRSRHLLSLARTILHYEDALTKANGERFNLFDILHVGHYEVRTHSPILAEFLNPKGSHGQGSVFLRHFLTGLNIQHFDAASARVVPEVSIGELGRLDIEITDHSNRCILIENKIYAGLQEKQLERYHEYNTKAHLLFLTLNGEFPYDWESNPSYKADSFKKVFRRISYKTDIVQWLEACRKEAAAAPGVREAITQYIYLIQRLTDQNTSARMNQEIIRAVTQDSSFYLAYASLRNANGDIRKTIISKVNAQLDAIGQELGLETVRAFAAKGATYEGYFFTTPALRAHNLQFGIECQAADYRNFWFGFSFLSSEPGSRLRIEPYFKEAFPTKFESSIGWPACPYWEKHRNWNDETMAAIISDEFANELSELISKLARVAAAALESSGVTPSTPNPQL